MTRPKGGTNIRSIHPIIARLPMGAPQGDLRGWIINLQVHDIDCHPTMDFMFITRYGLGQCIRRKGSIDKTKRNGVYGSALRMRPLWQRRMTVCSSLTPFLQRSGAGT